MRWLVEVTSLGKTEPDRLMVEADNWQGALLAARARRREPPSLGGFSVEVLDDGCRAVDAATMLKYELRPAPSRSRPPRAMGASAPARGSRPSPVSSAREAPPSPAATDAPSPAAAAAPSPAAADAPSPAAAAAPSPAAADAPSSAAADAGQLDLPPMSSRQPTMPGAGEVGPASLPLPPGSPVSPAEPEALERGASASGDSGAIAPPSSERRASTVPSQVIYKREEDRTRAVPLTYREYVYVVPPGTTDAEARALLEMQLELVRTSLASLPAGKLVNLAAFAAQGRGKPQGQPVATLSWKDWKGASVVAFPRRPSSDAAPVPTLVAADPYPEPAGHGVLEPAQAAVRPQPRRSSHPRMTPAKGSGGRVHGEELIADLFEAMHDLHFCRDAVEGGNFCLALGMDKIPSQAGIVHLYDINRREFITTSTRGAGTAPLLLQRHSEVDPMLSRAMRLRRAVVVHDGAAAEATPLERYQVVGGARSLIVAPVMQLGRFLGAIELLNPLDGQPFTASDGNAMTYIAEQFAEFVATRGVVTDPERIAAHRLAGA